MDKESEIPTFELEQPYVQQILDLLDVKTKVDATGKKYEGLGYVNLQTAKHEKWTLVLFWSPAGHKHFPIRIEFPDGKNGYFIFSCDPKDIEIVIRNAYSAHAKDRSTE